MRVVAIIQARMGSTRLPGKVLRPLAGIPMLRRIVERVSGANRLDAIAVATSDAIVDDAVERLCATIPGVHCFRGSEFDVLDRFYGCAVSLDADVLVRLTGDDPFFDPAIIDDALVLFDEKKEFDYLFYREGLPLGMAVEVFRFDSLSRAWREASDSECREHVTPYLYRNPELFRSFRAPMEGRDLSSIRLTVDTPEDFEVAEWIYETLSGQGGTFGIDEIVALVEGSDTRLANEGVEQKVVSYQGEGR